MIVVYRTEYPQPQFRRKHWQNLNGHGSLLLMTLMKANGSNGIESTTGQNTSRCRLLIRVN